MTPRFASRRDPGVFFLAALDESVQLHELGNAWLSGAVDTGGPLFAIWIIPATLVVLILAIVYRPFVAALPERVRRLATRGALVFVVGALGLEMIEGAITDSHGGDESFADGVVSVAQEFLEMFGVIVFVEALMTYLAMSGQAITIGFGRSTGMARWSRRKRPALSSTSAAGRDATEPAPASRSPGGLLGTLACAVTPNGQPGRARWQWRLTPSRRSTCGRSRGSGAPIPDAPMMRPVECPRW